MSGTPGSTRPGRREAGWTAAGRSAAGFTLIEVMFALTIFGVGILALIMCIPVTASRMMRSGAQTRASALATEMAEELLNVPYSNAQITAGTHNDTANPHDAVYYTRWVVEDDAPRASCKRITVFVSRNSVAAPPEARLVIVTSQSGG